uniref:SFRICE_015129 n=1 Tax=Spodoptera frugiperda TaxID=7108 RepID=A0A2H1W0R2_SPOFR
MLHTYLYNYKDRVEKPCKNCGSGPTVNPAALQPQPQGLIVETGNGASVLQLPATTLEQIRHIAADPGASTLRLPPPATEAPAGARELDFDLCYVCKHCKVAFPSPAPLQVHQARSCYAGREAARGVIRVVQPALECRSCPGERFRTALEFRRHADTEQHLRNTMPQPQLVQQPETLTHEMEDVVNQITLLAARAAQETAPPKDPNANFCAPGPRFQPPGELPLASAGH